MFEEFKLKPDPIDAGFFLLRASVMRIYFPFWVVSKLLAMVLITAAALKLHGLAVQPVSALGLLASTELQFAIVEFEIFLGLWLFSGRKPVGAWVTALAGFTIFSSFSVYQGMIGRASCGCFGALAVNPWYAFFFDLLVLALLLAGRPAIASQYQIVPSRMKAAAMSIAIVLPSVVAICSVLAGTAILAFGSTKSALAWLRGERISIEPRLANFGTATPGESRHTRVELMNWTTTPIRIIGGTSDCSCDVHGDLPITIPPQEGRFVNITFRVPDSSGIASRKAFFLTDEKEVPVLYFRLSARVVSASEAE